MASSSTESDSCPNPEQPSCVDQQQDVHTTVCAYDMCKAMENLKLCASCKGTWYCGKEHQKRHWKVHKKSCTKRSTLQTQEATPKVDADEKLSSFGSHENIEQGGIILQGSSHDNATSIGAEIESANVQADIAQFSADIKRRHSYTLTPCKEDCATNSGTAGTGSVTLTKPKKASAHQRVAQQENMPPNNTPDTPQSGVNTNALVLYITEHMQKFGICVVDKFLTQEHGDNILKEVKTMREKDAFRNGQLVTTREMGSAKDIRGDMITWTDGSDPDTKSIGFLISKMDSIVQQCKEHLEGFKNISGRTEAMVACYPGNGTHYVKHVDNPNEDGRCVTCIYYLNKGWDSNKMGGILRLYPRCHNRMASVDPIFNRLLFFWSDRRNPHEVLPAHDTRYAITVWYFDALERKKAVASALS